MAEFETRAEDERCYSCKFFGAIDGKERGWCYKRPRLFQKHDDRVNRTDWCQFYQRSEDMTDEAKTATVEPQIPMSELNEQDSSAIITELGIIHQELSQFREQLLQQLSTAAMQDNTILMLETKGMVRVVQMFQTQLNARISFLSPSVGKTN